MNTTENANLSSPGLRLHCSSQSRRGSIGTHSCTRYIEVALDAASLSTGLSGFTKYETSAICTPTWGENNIEEQIMYYSVSQNPDTKFPRDISYALH